MELSCILAALLFTTGNVVKIIFFAQEKRRAHWDLEAWKSLDPDYAQEEWAFRLDTRGLWLASSCLNTIAWIFFAYPAIQMAWVLSNNGRQGIMCNISIAVLAFGGAMAEFFANFFWIGMTLAAEKLVKEFNLDEWVRNDVAGQDEGLGWRVTEMNHIIGSGFIWFVDSFEWLCLAGLFLFTFFSVRAYRTVDKTSFGSRWNSLSLFIGLLCLLEFVAEVLRFEGFRTFGAVALLWAALNRLILIPAWILSLGFMLPRALMKQKHTDVDPIGAELALTEISDKKKTSISGDNGNNFSIDDGDETMNDVPLSSPTSPPPEAFVKSP